MKKMSLIVSTTWRLCDFCKINFLFTKGWIIKGEGKDTKEHFCCIHCAITKEDALKLATKRIKRC